MRLLAVDADAGNFSMKWEKRGEFHQHSGDWTIIRMHGLNDRVHFTLWGPGHNYGYFRTAEAAKKRAEEIVCEGRYKNER